MATTKNAVAAKANDNTNKVNTPAVPAVPAVPVHKLAVISDKAQCLLSDALNSAIAKHDKGKAVQAFVVPMQTLGKVLGTVAKGNLSPIGHRLYTSAGLPSSQVAMFELLIIQACKAGTRVNIAEVLLNGLKGGHCDRLSKVDDSLAHLARLRAHVLCMTGNNAARLACINKALSRVNQAKAQGTVIDAFKALLPYFDLMQAEVAGYIKAQAKVQASK